MGKCPSFYLKKKKKGKEKKKVEDVTVQEETAATQAALASGYRRESRSGEPVIRRPKPVVGSGVFSSVVWEFLCGGLGFTLVFSAFYRASGAFAAGKKSHFAFKIRTEREKKVFC